MLSHLLSYNYFYAIDGQMHLIARKFSIFFDASNECPCHLISLFSALSVLYLIGDRVLLDCFLILACPQKISSNELWLLPAADVKLKQNFNRYLHIFEFFISKFQSIDTKFYFNRYLRCQILNFKIRPFKQNFNTYLQYLYLLEIKISVNLNKIGRGR